MGRRHNWDRFDALAVQIEGAPEENRFALRREQLRLTKLMQMKRYDEALENEVANLEYFIVDLVQSLANAKPGGLSRDEALEIFEAYLQAMEVSTREIRVVRPVQVARYDGRELPYWREVVALDASHLGAKRISRGGGTGTTVVTLLNQFQTTLNERRSDDERVILINETGLPTQPGENQTLGSICLTYNYAFWTGDGCEELTKEWFENNFGITFHEEERELTLLELY